MMNPTFEQELRHWGPNGNRLRTCTLEEARRYCRDLATSHYENFPVVTWMLPKKLHAHFFHIYAYCRWSDDLGDEVEGNERSLELLDWWEGELEGCYQGRAGHPVFLALRETIDRFSIPIEPFRDLLSAFRQDQRVKTYDTFEQLRDYCRRSADPVGRLVLYLCECATPENFALSDSVCTGLQLANFWQDVNRDLDIGRVYLPKEDCAKFGYSWEDLQQRVTNPQFLALMEFEVQRARDWLRAGLPLVSRMPGRLQVDIDLFIRGGLKICDRIERIQFRVWEQRPVVTKGDGIRILAGSLLRSCLRPFRWSSGRKLEGRLLEDRSACRESQATPQKLR